MRRRIRKQMGWLLVVSVTAIGLLATVRGAWAPRPQPVTVRQILPTTVNDTVVCTGTVQAAEGEAVTASVPCVVKTVEVEVGERVEAGQVLLTVDRAATLSKALEMGMPVEGSSWSAAALPEAVTAPVSGQVRAVHAKAGDWIDSTSACAVLSESGHMEVAITVSESVLPLVKVGQTVRVTGTAFAKDGYKGRLTKLASVAHTSVGTNGSRTVVDGVVSLDPHQADASLLAGLSAKAIVTVATRERSIVVPYEAVVDREENTAAVYCVHGHTAYRRTVTVAGETPDGLEIESGLQMGEWIVSQAQELSGEQTTIYVEAVACRS